MRILESESRAGDSQERRRMHQQLRTFKSQIDKLKGNLQRSQLMDGSQQRQQTNDPKENLGRIDDHLGDAQGIIAQTEATAQNINKNLSDQREQLINVRTNVRAFSLLMLETWWFGTDVGFDICAVQVDETREDTAEAGLHLKKLKCKMFSQILLLYLVILGLVIVIIWRVISKFA
ncbi:hypothetical protein BBJ28_00015228 [Nothophytophthora sp. Chile5]|nr:hypothetical protein BBJ28_00015228 [Nothophytophthora sp. Chile5]